MLYFFRYCIVTIDVKQIFSELNVYDNIDYFCGLYIKNKKIRKQYVEESIKLVGLGEFRKYLPKQLSGGLLARQARHRTKR